MSFSKLTCTAVAILSFGYVDALAGLDFPSMMEVWAAAGPDVGPTSNTKWSTTFDFIKDHGCNCPALFDEFAFGGLDENDPLDKNCHTLRRCLKCASEDAACDSNDIDSLAFLWNWNNTAVCDSNPPCNLSKCQCYVDFLNSLIDNYDTNSKVAIAGDENHCVAAAGTTDTCCKVDDEWKLYDVNTHECKNNEIVQKTYARGLEYKMVDANLDWEMTFSLTINKARPTPFKSMSIFSVGQTDRIRLPGLWFHRQGEFDLLFASNCNNLSWRDQKVSPKLTTGWAIGETHNIKVEYMPAIMETYLYIDGVEIQYLDLNDCGQIAQQPLYMSDPWYESAGDFVSISNVNFKYM